MSFKKYLWKCRLLVLSTPNYSHPEYKRSKDLYQKEIKGFHKRYIKLVTKLDKSISIFSYNSFNIFSFYDIDHGERDGGNLKDWVHENIRKFNIDVKITKIKIHKYFIYIY